MTKGSVLDNMLICYVIAWPAMLISNYKFSAQCSMPTSSNYKIGGNWFLVTVARLIKMFLMKM